ncbi:MAG: type VI secretion system baseplate subunit TssF, partial [Rhodobacteraceae bacterium]|nr:type VI secretion system baseplate subunit TssF [Paracoccaceae bacterium]
MDTRLVKHYESELMYLRDMGSEFAAAYPKIAARLGMDGVEVLDPYVERLLEGVAFLSARVQLELELQYPAFTSNLLEIIYPHYLAPTPSMMIAAFEPDPANSAIKDGYVMPRQTVLRSRLMENEQTPCEFRTAAEMTMWPVEISEAEYIDGRGALVAAGVAGNVTAKAGIRLRLRRTDGEPIAELAMDNLVVHLNRGSGNSWLLLEVLCSQAQGLCGRSTDRRADWTEFLKDGAVEARGFEQDEALLPTPRRSFDGYRLLQEYFAMPERFLFVDLQGLQPALKRAKGEDVDIYILLKEGRREIAPMVVPDAFTLNAVPAINLFPKRCDRVNINARDTEQHVIPSRTSGMDFEVYSLESVAGISGQGADDVAFRPFYSSTDFTAAGESHPAYYTLRRRMRQRSEKERLR